MSARFRSLAVWAVAVVLAAVWPIAAPAQAQKYDALLGTWDVKLEDGSREFVFEFALEEGKLVGKYTGASGSVAMTDLTFENNTVKFNVTVGNGMVITYSAVVAEDRLSGTLELEFGDASIVGERRK